MRRFSPFLMLLMALHGCELDPPWSPPDDPTDGGTWSYDELPAGGAFSGRLEGPFVYGPGKVEAMEAFAPADEIEAPPTETPPVAPAPARREATTTEPMSSMERSRPSPRTSSGITLRIF